MITFSKVCLQDVQGEVEELLERHWREIALDHEKVPLDPRWEHYARLEQSGIFHALAAWDDAGRIVGYYAALVTPHLHYGSTVCAFTDIYYVAPEHRQGMLGVRLFQQAEAMLRNLGVQKWAIQCKLAIDMTPIFERMGFTLVEKLFTKMLE